jgi:hypothetical protein
LTILENNLIQAENPAFIEKFNSSISKNDHIGTSPPTMKCVECKKKIHSNKITSVFKNKQVHFCSYDCLEKNKSFN